MIAHDCFRFACFFTGGGGALVRPGELHPAAAARGQTAALNFFGRFFGDDLQVEERTDGGRVDAVEHRLKHVEAFLLVFDQRILLAVTNQADALLQVIQRQQVVLPLRIDDVQHDDALVSAHRLVANLLFLLGVLALELLPKEVFDFLRRRVLEIDLFKLAIERVHRVNLNFVILDVPGFRRGVQVEVLRGEIRKQIARDSGFPHHEFALVGLFH